MIISALTAATVAKLLMAAKIAVAVGPVFIAAQRVVDDVKKKQH
jgi:hypothetical protein